MNQTLPRTRKQPKLIKMYIHYGVTGGVKLNLATLIEVFYYCMGYGTYHGIVRDWIGWLHTYLVFEWSYSGCPGLK